ncbi:MAG: hypothetical protein IIA60_08740 [Candidatus Marinimicrobia bacterium]|nr:hypothetical protein [Candidatus Neomarinimicrobiota bacterium]
MRPRSQALSLRVVGIEYSINLLYGDSYSANFERMLLGPFFRNFTKRG